VFFERIYFRKAWRRNLSRRKIGRLICQQFERNWIKIQIIQCSLIVQTRLRLLLWSWGAAQRFFESTEKTIIFYEIEVILTLKNRLQKNCSPLKFALKRVADGDANGTFIADGSHWWSCSSTFMTLLMGC
jgi:hypothetical protein